MLCRDLIKILEKMIEDNKPHEEVMGEAEIMIDQFAAVRSDEPGLYYYKGIDPDIRITHTNDGVYSVLTAFVKETT